MTTCGCCVAQISWYFEIGRTYLEKPRYESVDKLIEPTPEQLAKMFLEIDEDDSGEVDLHEVHEALSHLWPCMDVQGFQRAFEAADLDASGHIDMEEFKHLLSTPTRCVCLQKRKRNQIPTQNVKNESKIIRLETSKPCGHSRSLSCIITKSFNCFDQRHWLIQAS